MYIKAYSEYMVYSDIFSQPQALYSGITHEQCNAYSGPCLSIFRYIWNSGLYIRFTHMQAYSVTLNMSLSNALCKMRNFKTWNQKFLICVILAFSLRNYCHI